MSTPFKIVTKEEPYIEVVSTDISDLAMMGFGSVENCMSVYTALCKKYVNVKFNKIKTLSDLEHIVERKPDLVFTGIKYVVFDHHEITKYAKIRYGYLTILRMQESTALVREKRPLN